MKSATMPRMAKESAMNDLEKQDLARALERIHGYKPSAKYAPIPNAKIRNTLVRTEKKPLDNMNDYVFRAI